MSIAVSYIDTRDAISYIDTMDTTGRLRGWIRASARHSEQMQRRALDEAGCTAIYAAGPDTIDDLIGSLRPPAAKKQRGDVVLVTSLARIGRDRRELRRALDAIHSRGAVIVEARNPPRRSDDRHDLASMLLDAADELAGDRRALSPADARTHGRKGGLAKGRRAREARTPNGEALAAWRDLSLTGAQAIEDPRMAGWTVRMAYRLLGKRNTALGVVTGRPRKQLAKD